MLYVDLCVDEGTSKDDYQDLLYDEMQEVKSQLTDSEGKPAAFDFLNPTHISLLELQPRYKQLMAYYKEHFPGNEMLFAEIRSLGFDIKPRDESSLPYDEPRLLKRIKMDREMVREFQHTDSRGNDGFYKLIDFIERLVINTMALCESNKHQPIKGEQPIDDNAL